MGKTTNSEPEIHDGTSGQQDNTPHHQQTEDYAGGNIKAYHGRINWWLAAVYFVLFVWAIYYGFTYWGGLGPGLNYKAYDEITEPIDK